MRGLEAALDRRLSAASRAPLAVALSGGGDSLALTLAAKAWADRHGRGLLVLTVDHRLRPESARWTETCAATAARLGCDFKALAWTGVKPATGLPAAARSARHSLVADAAREAGARVILMGHTASDLTETARMRATGSTTPDAREWGPSPAWPEGRGLFVLRPMLGLDRAAIRAWLVARGETWIDDPANEDLRFARARARADPTDAAPALPPADASALALACSGGDDGVLAIDRERLRKATAAQARAFAAAACLCAAGTMRPPRGERADRLATALRGADALTATLAGARIEADAATVRFRREAGEAARGGLAPMATPEGRPVVWDGRFEVTAPRAGLTVRAHGVLPVFVDADGEVVPATGRALALDRLRAACGAVEREPA